MADSEWFCVETTQGTKLSGGDRVTDFTNKEAATSAARNLAQTVPEDVLVLVKYSRKEVRTFRRSVTIQEADLPS